MRLFGGVMAARILDGAGIARELRNEMRETVAAAVAAGKRPPGLAVILVGNDPGSVVYVNAKRRDCDQVGFHSVVQHVSANVTQQELESRVTALNRDSSIDGILVQLPLPAHIDADRIIDRIEPEQERALLSYVAEGGAFVPIHCATYCFRNSAKIVVMEKGRIVEIGDHNELVALGGLYAQQDELHARIAASGAKRDYAPTNEFDDEVPGLAPA